MIVRDYLKRLPENMSATFLKARARKDANTPFYHAEYQTTPLLAVWEWLEGHSSVLDAVVLNDKQESITWLSGADWNPDIRAGRSICLVVISREDMETLYPNKEQREGTEAYIENKLSL